MSKMKVSNNIAEKSLNDEKERLTKENKYQRQDINQLQFTNKMLEEHIHKKNFEQSNEGNDQM